jgi:DNA-directed RNA polymerase subunit alpha
MPIEELGLSMRAYNCLRRSGLVTVGQVMEKSEEELLNLRNFGRKSYDELRDKLEDLGLLPKDGGPMMEALPLEEEEGVPRAERVAEAEAPEDEVEAEAAAEPPAAAAESDEDEELSDWQKRLLSLKDDVEGEEE